MNISHRTEAYPDIRFITELRYEDKPHLTMVSALPESAKSNDAFEGMRGSFFSSDTAAEAVLQKSFAEELLGKAPARGVDETNVADLAKPLLGKELTMRYAQRAAKPARPSPQLLRCSRQIRRHRVLRENGQDHRRRRDGPEHARVFLPRHFPLKLAESLRVMHPPTCANARGAPDRSFLSVRGEGSSAGSSRECNKK